ncbi:MAG: DUF349 domain-containing protein [Bacteroidia bacterium]|nr:DUF349 domain-containing protein [Bacteroidia bacterium]
MSENVNSSNELTSAEAGQLKEEETKVVKKVVRKKQKKESTDEPAVIPVSDVTETDSTASQDVTEGKLSKKDTKKRMSKETVTKKPVKKTAKVSIPKPRKEKAVPEAITSDHVETPEIPVLAEEVLQETVSSRVPFEKMAKVKEEADIATLPEIQSVQIAVEPAEIQTSTVSLVDDNISSLVVDEQIVEVKGKTDIALSPETPSETVTDEPEVKTGQAELIVSDTEEDEVIIPAPDQEFTEDEEEMEVSGGHADYSVYEKPELIGILRELLQNEYHPSVKNNIENIKLNFYKKHRFEIDEKRRNFVESGQPAEQFVIEPDPVEAEFKDLYNVYKSLRTDFNEKLESEKEENLKKKYKIIEEIKDLTNNQESINRTFNEFRDLQRRWREIGLVPQAELKNLWETYHYHVEKFYDFVKINRELRDLDLKKNLEEKIKLCDKAEELLIEPNVVRAFKALQKYHDQWREIGPVPNEKKEEIWERFREVTNMINKKHQDYFESIRKEQENNLEAKTLLCEKAEEITAAAIDSHKDWEKYTAEIIEIQKLWRTIGFATRKDNTRIYERFRTACDSFFSAKRGYYDENKEEQNNNLQFKTDLCIQAESLKDSTDWKKTTEDFIKLQEKWKTIGPVARKHSDVIWKRFRAACNHFFEVKGKYFSNIDEQYEENLRKKLEIIEKVEKLEQSENSSDMLEILKNFQKEFTEIGHVPIRMKDKVQKQFREALNKQFDNLHIDDVKRTVFLYKQKMEIIPQPGRPVRQFRVEKDRILSNIKQLETDIALLENNIGFFARTKNAEALINDVNAKIEKARKNILIEKQKLDIIHKMENQKL